MEFLSLNSWMEMALSEGERRSRSGGQDMQLIWGAVKMREKQGGLLEIHVQHQVLEEPEERVRSLREREKSKKKGGGKTLGTPIQVHEQVNYESITKETSKEQPELGADPGKGKVIRGKGR